MLLVEDDDVMDFDDVIGFEVVENVMSVFCLSLDLVVMSFLLFFWFVVNNKFVGNALNFVVVFSGFVS